MSNTNGAARRLRLRELRLNQRAPLNQLKVLGARIGYSKTQISDVERGKIGAGPDLVTALARVYRRKPTYIRRLCREARHDAAVA